MKEINERDPKATSITAKVDLNIYMKFEILNYPSSKHPNTPTKGGHNSACLATESSRTRIDVLLGNGVVDVDQDAGVISLVGAWKGDQVGRLYAATTTDSNLCAREEELRAILRLGKLQGDLLIAHEIITRRDAGRYGDGDILYSCNLDVSVYFSKTKTLTVSG